MLVKSHFEFDVFQIGYKTPQEIFFLSKKFLMESNKTIIEKFLKLIVHNPGDFISHNPITYKLII